MTQQADLIEVTQELREATKRLDKASRTIFQLAKAKAEMERTYREELAKVMMELRAEGVQAALIPDIARGKCSYLKYERDLAADTHKSALSALEAIKTSCSALQTICRYHEVM
ncbi:hypothetical protein [Ectobacillus antri]|uniref:hypothetical protein n=1 Tax=Ectobacillus antri TaxID=2486280 RepID=UPI000F5B59C5|nr:hypothetical protein [Ectobacillus antri]